MTVDSVPDEPSPSDDPEPSPSERKARREKFFSPLPVVQAVKPGEVAETLAELLERIKLEALEREAAAKDKP